MLEKKIIIFGLEQFADQLARNLTEAGREVVAFTVDKAYLPAGGAHGGLPVVPFEECGQIYAPDEHELLFCIGYHRMNHTREEKFAQARAMGYTIASYRHPSAIIQADSIGEGNIFMEGVVIGQGVKIGEGNIFWPCSHVAHHTTVGNYNFFTISCAVAGNIVIHDHCVFGNNCTIRNGIDIAEGCLIGAGAYIAHSTEADSVYVPPRSYKLEGKKPMEMHI